jgi:hypothetical protein
MSSASTHQFYEERRHSTGVLAGGTCNTRVHAHQAMAAHNATTINDDELLLLHSTLLLSLQRRQGLVHRICHFALLENRGLVHFGLDHCSLDNHCWSELMAVISTHPTLRSLCFRGGSGDRKRARTKSVADMLLVNKRVDRIHFDSDTFDRDY